MDVETVMEADAKDQEEGVGKQRGRGGGGTNLEGGVLSRRGRGTKTGEGTKGKEWGEVSGRGKQVKGEVEPSGRGMQGKWDREEGWGTELKRSGGPGGRAGRIQWKRREGPIEMGRGTKWKGEGMQRTGWGEAGVEGPSGRGR